jgi:hypothetical protein
MAVSIYFLNKHAVELGIINPPPRKNFRGQKISKEQKGQHKKSLEIQ